jgi:hypothetical protein
MVPVVKMVGHPAAEAHARSALGPTHTCIVVWRDRPGARKCCRSGCDDGGGEKVRWVGRFSCGVRATPEGMKGNLYASRRDD